MLLAHLPQVRLVARTVWGRTRFQVELDDLIGYGTLGLLDAVRKFDPGRGVLLKTYAEHRIRGAILDGLRTLDWLSRSARREAKAQSVHYAGALELNRRQQVNSECSPADDAESAHPRLRHAGLYSQEASQERIVESKQQREALSQALEKLPERHKEILELHYRQEWSMKQIAAHIGVHQSRVSQLHMAAIVRLRKLLGAKPPQPAFRRPPSHAVLS